MIDPPYVNPQYHVNIKRCAYRCAIPLAVLLTLVLAIVLVIYYLLLGFNMLPPAGTSPLILFGLQWWPIPEPGVVCPGSAAAYRLDEAWVGGSDRSFFDPDSWNFWHDTADPTGGPTQYVDHDTATANGLIEEGDGWAVIRAGRPVRPDSSDLVPSSFQGVEGPQMRQSVRMTSKRSWRRFLLSVRYTHLPYGCGLWPAVWFWCADVEPGPDGQPARCPAWPVGSAWSNALLGSARLRLLSLLRARLAALGGALPGAEAAPLGAQPLGAQPLGAQPLPRVLEPATSQAADPAHRLALAGGRRARRARVLEPVLHEELVAPRRGRGVHARRRRNRRLR